MKLLARKSCVFFLAFFLLCVAVYSDDSQKKRSILKDDGTFNLVPGETHKLTPEDDLMLKKYAGFKAGFLRTGSDFLKLSSSDRFSYCAGACDAIMISSFFCLDPDKSKYHDVSVKWIEELTENMQPAQLDGVITMYIKNHPEFWHLPANYLVLKALIDAYEKKYGSKPKFAITNSIY